MAEAALTFLLENVHTLLVERLDLIAGAESEMKALKNEVELMIALLKDLEKNQEKGETFLQLEKQIREAVYDAEDTLDACLTQKSLEKKVTTILNLKAIDLAKKVRQLRVEGLMPIFSKATETLTALQPMLQVSASRPSRSHDKRRKRKEKREIVGQLSGLKIHVQGSEVVDVGRAAVG